MFRLEHLWSSAYSFHYVCLLQLLAFLIEDYIQRLRCRCNFYALQFVPKIQEGGALILQRIRQNSSYAGPLDNYLLGPHAKKMVKGKRGHSVKGPKYLALHLRFEIDMVAHSLCNFGGGEEERKELEAYRQIHFPALTRLEKNDKYVMLSLLKVANELVLPLFFFVDLFPFYGSSLLIFDMFWAVN